MGIDEVCFQRGSRQVQEIAAYQPVQRTALRAAADPFVRRQWADRFAIRQVMAKGEKTLEIIAVVLVVLWLLGFVTSYTMGGFIHILLVIAVVMVLFRVIRGRRF